MADENTITTVFRANIDQFSASAQGMKRYMNQINAEFQEATAGMGKWSDSTDGLKAKINQLNGTLAANKKVLSDLESQYNELSDDQKQNSVQGQKLATQILKQRAEVKKTESEIGRYSKSLEELEKAGVNTKQELDELTKSVEKQGESAGRIGTKIAKGIGVGLAAVGTASVAAGKKLFDFATQVSETGDQIDKESQKLGISAEKYQQLSYAMERSGADIEDFTRGMKTITTELADVENGVDGAGASFKALGISMKNTDGTMKSSEQILLDSIDALAQMENETQRNALAQEIFGRSAAELNPLLNSGSEGIKQLMQEAKDYGMVMNDDAVTASATFQDSLTRLQWTMNGLKTNIGGALLPSLSLITDGFTDMIAGVDGGAEKLEKGVSDLVDNIAKILPKFVEYVSTIVTTVLANAPKIIKALAQGIIETTPTLIPVFVQLATDLVQLVLDIVPQLVGALGTIIPEFANAIINALPILVASIVNSLPLVLDGVMQLIMGIVEALPTLIGNLVGAIPTIINTIIDALISFFPQLIDASITLLMALVDAIPMIIDALSPQLPLIVTTIIDGLLKMLPQLLNGAIKLLEAIIKAIPLLIKKLVPKIPQIVTSIVNALTSRIGDVINGALQLFFGIIEAIPLIIKELIPQIPTIVQAIVKGLLDCIPDMLEVGKDLIKGLWEGISSMGDWIVEKIKGFGKSITKGFKKIFGIKSPSKVFEDEIGKNLALGIGEGFTDEMKSVEKDMIHSLDGITPSLAYDTTSNVGFGGMFNNDFINKLANLINAKTNIINNNYDFDYKFEKMETSKLALHKAVLETKRVIGG